MPYVLETSWTISTAPPAANLAVQVRDNAGAVVPGVTVEPVVSRGGPTYTALVSNIPDALVGYIQIINTISGTPISIRGVSPQDAGGGGGACDTLACLLSGGLSVGYSGGGAPTTLADYIHAICNGRCTALCNGGGGGGGCCGNCGGGTPPCSSPVAPHCHQLCVTNPMGVPLQGVVLEMYTDPARANRVEMAITDVDGVALLCATTGGTFYVFRTLAGYTFSDPLIVNIP